MSRSPEHSCACGLFPDFFSTGEARAKDIHKIMDRTVPTESGVIEYRLVRTRRKHSIAVEVMPNRTVRVLAPKRHPLRAIDEVVRKREAWIVGRLHALSSMPCFRYASGQTCWFLGNPLTLQVRSFAETTLRAPLVRDEILWLPIRGLSTCGAAEGAPTPMYSGLHPSRDASCAHPTNAAAQASFLDVSAFSIASGFSTPSVLSMSSGFSDATQHRGRLDGSHAEDQGTQDARQGPTEYSDKDSEKVRRALHRWYREEAARWIENRVALYGARLGRMPTRIFIRDQRRRWGSCSHRGELRFNWRLVQAPLSLLDHVVVHELCHLHHMNHSEDFWALVSSMLPDHRAREQTLRTWQPRLMHAMQT